MRGNSHSASWAAWQRPGVAPGGEGLPEAAQQENELGFEVRGTEGEKGPVHSQHGGPELEEGAARQHWGLRKPFPSCWSEALGLITQPRLPVPSTLPGTMGFPGAGRVPQMASPGVAATGGLPSVCGQRHRFRGLSTHCHMRSCSRRSRPLLLHGRA